MAGSAEELSRSSSLVRQLSDAVRIVEPNARLSWERYLATANLLLEQADGYRKVANEEQLYVLLMRFASLIVETIPKHPNFVRGDPKYEELKKALLSSYLPELEALKESLNKKDEAQRRKRCKKSTEPSDAAGQLSTSQASMVSSSSMAATALVASKRIPNQGSSLGIVEGHHPAPETSCGNTSLHPLSTNPSLPSATAATPEAASVKDEVSNQVLPTGQTPVTPIARISTPSMTPAGPASCTLTPDQRPLLHSDAQQLGQAAAISLQQVVNSTAVTIDSAATAEARMAQMLPAVPYPTVMRPTPTATEKQEVPVQPKAGTRGLRSFIIPADTLEKFLVCTSNASENHTLHSIGFLAGRIISDKSQILLTDLVIPRQTQTRDNAVAAGENEIIDFIVTNDKIIVGFIVALPDSRALDLSEATKFTTLGYQTLLPEAVSIVVAPPKEAPKFRVLHLVQHTNAPNGQAPQQTKWEDCTHVLFSSLHSVNIADLR